MPRRRQMPILLLLAVLLAACNWPLSHLEAEPLAAARPSATEPAIAFVSPLATPGQAATLPVSTVSTPVAVLGFGGLFSGRMVRFDLPEGYHVLEGVDGGCFVYHESLPGFLVLYPAPGGAGETLTGLLNATTNTRRTESPLMVDLGGLTFVGLFVETDADSRLFLGAADGWALVTQGPVGDWPALATGLNQVLTSLSFEENHR